MSQPQINGNRRNARCSVPVQAGRSVLHYRHRATKQRGAVLLVSLMVLTVMSVLTVAGMNSAITNEQMAANHQFREVSFQVADSGGNRAIGQDEWVNNTLCRLDESQPDWPEYAIEVADGRSTLSVVMQARRSPMFGNSIRQGGTFMYYTIETQSDATSYGNVSSTIVKGFTRAGAG